MFHKTIINQLLMIRKLPFMLIALCFLLSCGGDDPLDIKLDSALAASLSSCVGGW